MDIPTDPPRDLREACRTPAYEKALAQLAERTYEKDVVDDLVQSGLDEETAARVVRNARVLVESAKLAPGNLQIAGGAILVGAGLGITVLTMMAAESGGIYIIWYGAVVVGLALIARGVSMNRAPDLHAFRVRLDAAVEAGRRDREGIVAKAAEPSAEAGKYEY